LQNITYEASEDTCILTKVPNTNKVFVVGTLLGLILIHTERQNSKDDAFTNNAIKMIEDEESGVATKLNIKICSR
jgi:hypothetical protein